VAFDTIDGALLKEMILNGAAMLEESKAEINQLNVFPVPDGDTGTNMSLTMANACREVQNLQEALTCHSVAEALARGALKGARGNSGVILSQLFRGFYRGVDGLEEMGSKQFADALKSGVETAYKAVMKPREGTILTVSRAFADEAVRQAGRELDVALVVEGAMAVGELTLSKTPEMLDVLKKAGVVDAGGKGLLTIYKGFLYSLQGNGLISLEEKEAPPPQAAAPAEAPAAIRGGEVIEKGYCTEFLIENLKPEVDDAAVDRMRDRLERLGDSIVLVHDDSILKVHVHTESPDKVLMFALQMGELMQIKIENMREQNREIQRLNNAKPAAPKEQAIVAVASGDGIRGIFHDILVEGFVEGGQTMNPSAEDIATVVRQVNAKNVIVLPNNGNIILAAQQAAELVSCKVFVVPTRTIPQGISAALAYNPEASAEENAASMTAAMDAVRSGTVTYAVRDSSMDGHSIRKGDVLGISDGSIQCVGTSVHDVTLELAKGLADENSCMISFYWGADVSREDALALRDAVRREIPHCDAEAYDGGQPIYYYIVSVE
jgi:DAK2 domain fusion protein YloV